MSYELDQIRLLQRKVAELEEQVKFLLSYVLKEGTVEYYTDDFVAIPENNYVA